MIAFDQPGTTRDAIHLDFERGERRYTLIDTAGVRRRGKVFEAVEKFSVVKTLQAIEDAHVVVLLLDATQGITEQDAHIAGHILERAARWWSRSTSGTRPTPSSARAISARSRAQARLPGLRRAALRSRRATAAASRRCCSSVDAAYAAAMAKLPTPRLTRTLQTPCCASSRRAPASSARSCATRTRAA